MEGRRVSPSVAAIIIVLVIALVIVLYFVWWSKPSAPTSTKGTPPIIPGPKGPAAGGIKGAGKPTMAPPMMPLTLEHKKAFEKKKAEEPQ